LKNVGLSRLNPIFFSKIRVEPAQLDRVEPAQPEFNPSGPNRPTISFVTFFPTFGMSRLNSDFRRSGLTWTDCGEPQAWADGGEHQAWLLEKLNSKKWGRKSFGQAQIKKLKKQSFWTKNLNSGVLRVARGGSGAKAPPLAARPNTPIFFPPWLRPTLMARGSCGAKAPPPPRVQRFDIFQ